MLLVYIFSYLGWALGSSPREASYTSGWRWLHRHGSSLAWLSRGCWGTCRRGGVDLLWTVHMLKEQFLGPLTRGSSCRYLIVTCTGCSSCCHGCVYRAHSPFAWSVEAIAQYLSHSFPCAVSANYSGGGAATSTPSSAVALCPSSGQSVCHTSTFFNLFFLF